MKNFRKDPPVRHSKISNPTYLIKCWEVFLNLPASLLKEPLKFDGWLKHDQNLKIHKKSTQA
jgi:hypothetical protein